MNRARVVVDLVEVGLRLVYVVCVLALMLAPFLIAGILVLIFRVLRRLGFWGKGGTGPPLPLGGGGKGTCNRRFRPGELGDSRMRRPGA